MYKILVKYQTGNSLESEDTEDCVEYSWKNIEIAKSNLKRIQEHHEMCKELNIYRKEYVLPTEKDWFVYQPVYYNLKGNAISEKQATSQKVLSVGADYTIAQISIKLQKDDLTFFKTSAFWEGHFEYLYSVELIIDLSDSKITF